MRMVAVINGAPPSPGLKQQLTSPKDQSQEPKKSIMDTRMLLHQRGNRQTPIELVFGRCADGFQRDLGRCPGQTPDNHDNKHCTS